MYNFIFQSELVTSVAGLVLLVTACALAARPGFWWRALALNFAPTIGVGFLVAVLLSDKNVSSVDVCSAIIFEFTILCVYCKLSYLSYGFLHKVPIRLVTRTQGLCLALYTFAFFLTTLSSGFGIFSEGTRIDYLYESSGAKYLTYGGLMLSIILGGMLARRITVNHKPLLFDYVAILVYSATSILAGSKGGFVLWVGAILALINYREARIRSQTIALAVAGLAGLVTILAIVVSDFLRLSIPEFFALVFGRFFITNDARALAFDMRALQVPPNLSLVSEAFRSISSLFGFPPQNAPLGGELYDGYFGPQGGAGANASLTALVIYYTAPDYAVLPLVMATLAVGLLFILTRLAWRHMPNDVMRFVIIAIAGLDFALLSQDFLAFQVVLPITVLLALVFFISGSVHAPAIERPRRGAR